MKQKRILTVTVPVTVALLLAIAGCKKDEPEKKETPPPPPPGKEAAVYILNEGNFGTGKGNVTAYYPKSGKVVEDYFDQQNPGVPLGDVVYSMIRHKDEYFIVVNNSGKIAVCDLQFKKKGEITGLNSPRQILPLGGDLAYVSSFTGDGISLVNLSTRAVVQHVSLPGFTEGMVLHEGQVYVCNATRDYLYKVDPATHSVTDSILVGPGAATLAMDKNKRLWVLASGDFFTSTPGRLSCIDPAAWKVEKAMDFPGSAYASELCMNPGKDTLYYLDGGVRRLPVNGGALPANAFIDAGSMSFYALKIHPATRQVYVSDAVDYVQKSTVLVYNAAGAKVTEFKAGVIATDFYFE